MSKICPLYSGSTGNCTYIGTENCDILIDTGASCKGISEALCRVDSDIKNIKYVAVTHSHDDHIKGLKTVLKKTGATLIATQKTIDIIREKGYITEETIDKSVVRLLEKKFKCGLMDKPFLDEKGQSKEFRIYSSQLFSIRRHSLNSGR